MGFFFGIFLIMGNAGLSSSTVFHRQDRPGPVLYQSNIRKQIYNVNKTGYINQYIH